MAEMTVNRTEPDSIETLDLEPSFCHGWNSKEYIRIGIIPDENNTASLVSVHFDKNWRVLATQICLTLDEIDLVISGLVEAKKRMGQENI